MARDLQVLKDLITKYSIDNTELPSARLVDSKTDVK